MERDELYLTCRQNKMGSRSDHNCISSAAVLAELVESIESEIESEFRAILYGKLSEN